MIGDIAFVFGFPPSELMEMDTDDVVFWHKQAYRFAKAKGMIE